MTRILNFIERYKYGLIAAFAAYVGLFIYLELQTYESYYKIEPFFSQQQLEITPEDLLIQEEPLEQLNQTTGEVKNISRNQNDSRERSMENWSEIKAMSSKDVEQSVKDYERQLFDESGGEVQRKQLQEEIQKRKNQQVAKQNNKPISNASDNVKKNAFAGNVMVDWSLSGRNPHLNNNWYVRNPGYTCGHGASGRVVVTISVNQNGDVVEASVSNSTSANACMLEQALKYAKMSRFSYSGNASKLQQGTIIYTFVSQ
jgi:TonB family protein